MVYNVYNVYPLIDYIPKQVTRDKDSFHSSKK